MLLKRKQMLKKTIFSTLINKTNMKNPQSNQISNIINAMSFNPIEIGVDLTTDHRYLVHKLFDTFIHFSGQLKRDFEKGNYDDRNKYACKCASVIIDALDNAKLYDKKFWEPEYDKILNNLYK